MNSKEVEPLTLPEMSSEESEWQRELLGFVRQVPLAVGGSEIKVELIPPPSISEGPAIQIRVGSEPFWVRLADWNVLSGQADWLQDVDLTGLPKDVLAATFEVLLEDQFNRLSELVEQPCHTDGATDRTNIDGAEVSLGCRLRTSDGTSSLGVISTTSSGVELLRSLIRDIPPAEVNQVDSIPVVAGVQIGVTTLTVEALTNLQTHDVVLIEKTSLPQENVGLVRFTSEAIWRVAVEDDAVVLLELKPSPMPQPHAGASPTALVVFESGQVQVPMGDVTGLEPEQRLSKTDRDHIALRVHGQLVGRGELIQLGSRMAVRLTECSTSSVD